MTTNRYQLHEKASFVLVGGLQSWRWGGYPILIETILQAATVTLFGFAFQNHSEAEDHFPFRYFLLVSMAVSVFIEQQIADPAFNQLHLLYRGAITDDDLENNDKVLVTGINNKILIEAAKDAALAVGIHEKALGNIERVLAGQTIRDGEEDALDDWMFIVTKLSSVVSLARAPLGCIKTKMTTLEYRNLVRQMLIYLQTFKKRGKFGKEEAQKKRTVPLSVFETLMLMFKLAWQVKWYFLLALTPGTINGVLQPLTSPLM